MERARSRPIDLNGWAGCLIIINKKLLLMPAKSHILETGAEKHKRNGA